MLKSSVSNRKRLSLARYDYAKPIDGLLETSRTSRVSRPSHSGEHELKAKKYANTINTA